MIHEEGAKILEASFWLQEKFCFNFGLRLKKRKSLLRQALCRAPPEKSRKMFLVSKKLVSKNNF